MTGHRIRRLALGTAAAVLLGLVAAAPAPAAPTWLASHPLTGGLAMTAGTAVVADAAGNVTAVWTEMVGPDTYVRSSYRPVGGTWSPAVDVSGAGPIVIAPSVGVDAAGNVTAVWQLSGSPGSFVQTASRPVGGPWSPPSTCRTTWPPGPNLAVARSGAATAVWSTWDGDDYIIQSAQRPAGGAWGSPVDLSLDGGSALGPQVAVDDAGRATAVWQRAGPGSSPVTQSSSRSADGGWTPPVDLSAEGLIAAESDVSDDGRRPGHSRLVGPREHRGWSRPPRDQPTVRGATPSTSPLPPVARSPRVSSSTTRAPPRSRGTRGTPAAIACAPAAGPSAATLGDAARWGARRRRRHAGTPRDRWQG